MSRGGKRVGGKGKSYGQRTDLNAVAPASSQRPFGEQAQQMRSMAAVPVAPSPTAAAPGIEGMLAGFGGLPQTQPLDRPTERPGEPLTAGVPFGPGPGPEMIPRPLPNDPLVHAAATLNQLGDVADPQTAQYRALLNAVAGNSGAV